MRPSSASLAHAPSPPPDRPSLQRRTQQGSSPTSHLRLALRRRYTQRPYTAGNRASCQVFQTGQLLNPEGPAALFGPLFYPSLCSSASDSPSSFLAPQRKTTARSTTDHLWQLQLLPALAIPSGQRADCKHRPFNSSTPPCSSLCARCSSIHHNSRSSCSSTSNPAAPQSPPCSRPARRNCCQCLI